MAWRVSASPSLKHVIDSGPSPRSRETRRRRVASPRAANGAAFFSSSLSAKGLRLRALKPLPELLQLRDYGFNGRSVAEDHFAIFNFSLKGFF
jgi:hypothetical protein